MPGLMECPHGCGIPPVSPTQLDSHLWMAHEGNFTVVSKSPTDEEEAVLEAANALGMVRTDYALAVVRGIASGTKSYDAQRAADADHADRLAMAEARYEIALARLRRS